MSSVKRMMEHCEEQEQVATGIAIQAEVLKVCEYHPDCVFDGGSEEAGAYRLGNYKFGKGEFEGVFATSREMTDTIQKVIRDNNGIDKCPRC